MQNSNGVFQHIRNTIQNVLPTAEVKLFGSRATGTATVESDWDVLVLCDASVQKKTKNEVQQALFPISVQQAAFINLIIVSRDEWKHSPQYYALRKNIEHE